MRTLFLAWQDGGSSAHTGIAPRTGTRRWFPIGRLDSEPENHLFRFRYTHGAEDARDQAHFIALDAFPNLYRTYESPQLFPLFQNRLMRTDRADYPAFAERLGFSPSEEVDPFTVLGITGGERQTDPLEVFPKITTEADGRFHCRFFLHGWRHVNSAAQARLHTLVPGEPLSVAVELNNVATGAAVQLESSDYHMLGWAPRYLVNDLLNAMGRNVTELRAHVVRVNLPPAPHNQRVLVQLEGQYPKGVEPMSAPEFQPVAQEY